MDAGLALAVAGFAGLGLGIGVVVGASLVRLVRRHVDSDKMAPDERNERD